MESREKKKMRVFEEEEDMISMLPYELIHKILSFADAKEVVKTCVLSKRWKSIRKTLPFLNFGRYPKCSPHKTYMFIAHVLHKRNHQSNITVLNLCVTKKKCVSKKKNVECLARKFFVYAFEHNVECLDISLEYYNFPYNLPSFVSLSLKKLALSMEYGLELASRSWFLPELTSLSLKSSVAHEVFLLPDSCFTCLPALRTLCLDGWILCRRVRDSSSSSFSFDFPKLTNLRLSGCLLSDTIWNLPALLSLDIELCSLPENISHILSTLSNLQNLTIFFNYVYQDLLISCPRLQNLCLSTIYHLSPQGHIVVSAPKLHTFRCVGIISITFGDHVLEYVNIKLGRWSECMKEECCQQFTIMLQGLGNANNLSLTWTA